MAISDSKCSLFTGDHPGIAFTQMSPPISPFQSPFHRLLRFPFPFHTVLRLGTAFENEEWTHKEER